MPDTNTNHSNPKARLNLGDQVETILDDGSSITITRTRNNYRVVRLDIWMRPAESRDFPGQDHHQERAARDYAASLLRQIYTGGALIWKVRRVETGKTYTTTRPCGISTSPQPARQLQLV